MLEGKTVEGIIGDVRKHKRVRELLIRGTSEKAEVKDKRSGVEDKNRRQD